MNDAVRHLVVQNVDTRYVYRAPAPHCGRRRNQGGTADRLRPFWGSGSFCMQSNADKENLR